jgi:hypothetical protein
MQKDYIKGKVTKKTFDNGGHVLKLSIPMEELKRIENKGWVNIEISELREPRTHEGRTFTHSMYNNAYTPTEGTKDHPQYQQPMSREEQENIPTENFPF